MTLYVAFRGAVRLSPGSRAGLTRRPSATDDDRCLRGPRGRRAHDRSNSDEIAACARPLRLTNRRHMLPKLAARTCCVPGRDGPVGFLRRATTIGEG
jgi:hypothetical protein